MASTSSAGWARTIGIVGGLGPYAHIEFERLLLRATERLFGRPLLDQDYPPWILISTPQTPDRTRSIREEGPSPLEALTRSLRQVAGSAEFPGADFAVIPCNSAHAWLPQLRQRVGLPILDMVTEAIGVARERSGPQGRIGVLATTGALRAGLFRSPGDPSIIALPDLDLDGGGEDLQEQLVMTPIYGPLVEGRRVGGGIKSGNLADSVAPLRRAVAHLARAGARLVLAGCTEIPLVLGREPVDGVLLLDPMQVAADAAVAIAAGRRRLP